MFDINNRRYLGNKYKLLPFIKEVISDNCSDFSVFVDLFAGTGVVASLFYDKIIFTNDILYSNYISNVAWFSSEKYDEEKIKYYIDKYNVAKVKAENYMSINFENTYFDENNCKKIGYIREHIEGEYKNKKINFREKAILITSLIYAMDKIANTCGHYDAYIKKEIKSEKLELSLLNINKNNNKKNKNYNIDANELVKKISADIVYIDPPYNSRQYSDAYHLLENVARWEKPKVYGIAKKMNREKLKSKYCSNDATNIFEDLINNINAKYIILSYNNMGKKGNDRSNARISDGDIMRILKNKGEVKIFSKDYKVFTTGKSNIKENKERLFLCKVK